MIKLKYPLLTLILIPLLLVSVTSAARTIQIQVVDQAVGLGSETNGRFCMLFTKGSPISNTQCTANIPIGTLATNIPTIIANEINSCGIPGLQSVSVNPFDVVIITDGDVDAAGFECNDVEGKEITMLVQGLWTGDATKVRVSTPRPNRIVPNGTNPTQCFDITARNISGQPIPNPADIVWYMSNLVHVSGPGPVIPIGGMPTGGVATFTDCFRLAVVTGGKDKGTAEPRFTFDPPINDLDLQTLVVEDTTTIGAPIVINPVTLFVLSLFAGGALLGILIFYRAKHERQ